MSALKNVSAAALCSVLALPAFAQPVFAQDAEAAVPPQIANGACHDGHKGPVLQLQVRDLKKRKGQFRIELYPNDPDVFLEGEGRLYKYYVPIDDDEDAPICVTVPEKGDYGLVVIHDLNGNGKTDFLSDGFGMSNNPKLALSRPKLKEALFTVDSDETVLEIGMQYVTGNQRKRCRGSRCR